MSIVYIGLGLFIIIENGTVQKLFHFVFNITRLYDNYKSFGNFHSKYGGYFLNKIEMSLRIKWPLIKSIAKKLYILAKLKIE